MVRVIKYIKEKALTTVWLSSVFLRMCEYRRLNQ